MEKEAISKVVDEYMDEYGETAAASEKPTANDLVPEKAPDPTMFVTLPREELQLLLKRQEELETMVKQDREERQKLREEMEAMAQKDREERDKHREEMDMALKVLQVEAIVGRSCASLGTEEPLNDELDSLVDKELKLSQSSLSGTKNIISYRSLANSEGGLEIEWHTPFEDSVYTLLYMCDVQSQGFWYAMFVIAIQIITILLTMISVLDLDAEDHLIPLPAMVEPLVTFTQGFTLFLALAFQSDLIEAVLKLQDGYHPKVLLSHPGATFNTWLCSCLAQLLAGSLLLFTIFILTMGAEDVLSIMLNFAALNFLSHVDDLGFSLAEMGFVTNQLQSTVASMVDFKVPKRKSLNRSRRAFYLLTLIALFVGYGILKKRQLDGEYLPSYIYVQFGDSYNSKIPFYSGILRSQDTTTAYRRSYRDYSTGNILLAYCVAEKSWTFTENNNDPCQYFAKSTETTTYIVTSISDAEWQVKDSFNRLQPFDSFSLADRDCDPGTCQGICDDDGLCQCGPNSFGIDCEFIDVCPQVIADARFEAFPAVKYIPSENPWRDYDATAVGNAFHLLKNPSTEEYLRVYNMPVYYSNQTYPANIIFFGGRRWIVTSEWGLFNLWEAQNQNPAEWFFINSTVATLENGFHGFHKAQYTPLFISDPVDFETPNFLPTPAGLRWWRVKATDMEERHYEPDTPVDTILTCLETQPLSCIGAGEYFCKNEGICNNETGACDCTGSFSGNQCEVEEACFVTEDPCSHNGVCDHGNGASGFCRCNLPWYGKLCKEWYKCYEEQGECKSGGTCNMVTGDCDCPDDPAISGHACEKRGDCIFFGCANGGFCPGWQGECVCPPPFHGAHCELVDSSQEELLCSQDSDCMNGICNSETGICTCDDPASHGTLCERQFNCTKVFLKNEGWQPACQNLGTCNDDTGICNCPHPYSGPDCSQVPPCLSDEECDNEGGGSCNPDSGKCDCNFGPAAGNRCERSQWCTSDADCNAGACDPYYGTCRCPIGSGGRFCESLIVGMYPDYWDDKTQTDRENIAHYGFEALWDCGGGGNTSEICDLLP